jgi:predicted nucleic acid-binding protein
VYDPAELPEAIFITAITLAELSCGPHATNGPLTRAEEVAVLQHAEATFEPLPYDHHAARFYGLICAFMA